jgi:hypothetical protein
VEYHFSTEFMQMLTFFSSPGASTTLAVSPYENVTGYYLQVDQEIEIQQFKALVIDGAKVHDNQR